MSKPVIYKEFSAAKVDLSGSNLIEASAGTGKTYSIAILVLRLIVEKKLSIKEILMVTFTNAAVAELQDRVRLFIRLAYKASQGKEPIDDGNIASIVEQAIYQDTGKAVEQRLRDAILLLDEMAVQTIHSFCGQTLREFAFETDQVFGVEMLPSIDPVIENEVNKFWRTHITTLPVNLLSFIRKVDMKKKFYSIVKEHLGGKHYFAYNHAEQYQLNPGLIESWQREMQQLQEQDLRVYEEHILYVESNIETWKEPVSKNSYAKKSFLPVMDDVGAFYELAVVHWQKQSKYVWKLFPELMEMLNIKKEQEDQQELLRQKISRYLYCLAIQEIYAGVQQFMEINQSLSFDQQINSLHEAVMQGKSGLLEGLRNKYKAVFIDEFQDTDKVQYEIFHNLFQNHSILFYIGDPKQSIYGWRKADIFTYFSARNAVDHVYGMNQNFRSSRNMIEAMNQFFQPYEGFDTFYFQDSGDKIEYIPVESPDQDSKGTLNYGDQAVKAMPIIYDKTKESIQEKVAGLVLHLLTDPSFHIYVKGDRRAIKPSDIGILVRANAEGKDIKKYLSRYGIPSVTLQETRILQSDEAVELLYLLQAIVQPNQAAINRALLSSFTGFNIRQILQLPPEITLSYFTKYNDLWQQDGIYTAMMEFMKDFDTRRTLLMNTQVDGERVITNFIQLTELLHQEQTRKNLSMLDVIAWLQKGISGMETEGDEYIQRVESDEEAVNIVTVHKSKGLEYKIVIVPHLDFGKGMEREFVSLRDPVSGDYISIESKQLGELATSFEQQKIQEERRLIYVAITRAVYACYVFHNTKIAKAGENELAATSLGLFIQALEKLPEGLKQVQLGAEIPSVAGQMYRVEQRLPAKIPSVVAHFSLYQENWRKLSYTSLAAKNMHFQVAKQRPGLQDYEQFIFHTLRKGAKTGNLLHFLFENIRFDESKHWAEYIQQAIDHYAPNQREVYAPMLEQLLNEVLKATIEIDGLQFQLEQVPPGKRLMELEFDFPVPAFFPAALNQFSGEGIRVEARRFNISGNQGLEGMMNGKIDMFFQFRQKFYILDWKSNHLGYDRADYNREAIAKAMNDNNYHLQYLIYTVAVKKYLASRLDDFDYEQHFGGVIYCYVRGMRAGESNGVFTARPPLEQVINLERLIT